MKKKYALTLLAAALLSTACENDIDFNFGNPKELLVLNALISTDQDKNYIYLNLTGRTAVQTAPPATVTVSIDGEVVETCELAEFEEEQHYENSQCYLMTTRPQPGQEVRIDAHTNDGRHHAWASERVLQPPLLMEVDTVLQPPVYTRFADPRIVQLKFLATIKDRPDEENHYRITLEHRWLVEGNNALGEVEVYDYTTPDLWPWEDVVLTDGKPKTSEDLEDDDITAYVPNHFTVFNDRRFTNSSCQMAVSFFYGPSTHLGYFDSGTLNVWSTLKLSSISRMHYDYLQVMNYLVSGVQMDYIDDPAMLPANVKGGTGFVGISTDVTYTLKTVEDLGIDSEYWYQFW